MDAGTPQPEGIQPSLLSGARPRKLTRATALRTYLVGSATWGLVNLRGPLAKIHNLHSAGGISTFH